MEFPHVPDGEPVTVSASSYVAYRTCPDMAAARYEGLYGPDTPAAFVGGLAHQIFARHLRTGPIPEGDFVQACRESIGSSGLNNKIGPLGFKPSRLATVIEEVRDLYEKFKSVPLDGYASAEVELDVEPRPGVRLVGRVDAVFDASGGARLVDWKTGAVGEASTQLGFYALVWTITRGAPPVSVEAYSVRTGECSFDTPTPESLATTAAEVASMVADLRRTWAAGSAFPTRAGPWCRYCPRLEGCEEGVAAVGILDGHPRSEAAPNDG